jgi:hypothetical protein
MVIDFESINCAGDWWAAAVLVITYPQRVVLEYDSFFVRRPPEAFDDSTLRFWRKHPRAEAFIRKQATHPVDAQEQLLATYVRNILARYPHVTVLSDNVGFDIRLLNNILVRHHRKRVEFRHHHQYFQPVDTWSFLRGVRRANRYVQPVLRPRQDLSHYGPRHTPLADCFKIAHCHFAVLDQLPAHFSTPDHQHEHQHQQQQQQQQSRPHPPPTSGLPG